MCEAGLSRTLNSTIGYLLSLGIWLIGPNLAYGEEIARLDSAEGVVEVNRAGEPDFKPAKIGTTFQAHDVIHTTSGARAGVAFVDGTLIRLAENSSLEFKPRDDSRKVRPIGISEGKAYFFDREPTLQPIVDSPSATTAVRGTEFVIDVTADETRVSVLDGSVEMTNAAGNTMLQSGEQGTARKGIAPVKTILLRPLDAVQWALYYPVVFSEFDLAMFFPAQSPTERATFLKYARGDAVNVDRLPQPDRTVAKAFRLYNQNQVNQARGLLAALKNIPDGVAIFEASLALATGDTAGAVKIIDRLTLQTPTLPKVNAALSALKSIVALTGNETTKALDLATAAYGLAPELSCTALALAYTLQGRLRFDDAREVLSTYVAQNPSHSEALAHLAELELGSGNYADAVFHAQLALNQNHENWYALTVLGFSELIAGNTAAAQTEFEHAIDIDSTVALPRLGLGLTHIHRGDLETGRAEIAKAIYLAPNISIYRSYLGKAFFEQEREDLAGHEYERAIALDNKDPTPFLYRAFQRLSRNAPVLALKDVEHSIQLNDNRAVYRSSLLLDQDLAVRSAGLAETYNALGFSELARTEAIKSLNRDYSNYSAHLLLAEGYQSILLNDASLAERKVADLLAPLSFNLLGRSAGEASLNEYSALFDRPESRTQFGIDATSYADRIAPSAQFARKGESFGYGLGYEPVFTGGRKSGDYSQLERTTVAGEYQFGPADRLSVQGKGVYQRFDEASGSPDTLRAEEYSASLGYFHRFSARSKVIADLSGGNNINRFSFNDQERFLNLNTISNGERGLDQTLATINELAREQVRSERFAVQHLFDADLISAVTGVQQYRSNAKRREKSLVLADEQEIFDGLEYFLRSRQANVLDAEDIYHYATLHLTRNLHLTVGGTWSHVELEDREISPFLDHTRSETRFNPKIGLVALPVPETTLRAGYFESLRKSSLEDNLSIEPTLVGGINQRFTDFSGARSRNIGLGVDQKLGGSTYLGLETLQRFLIDTTRDGSSVVPLDFDDLTIGEPSSEAGTYFDTHRTQTVWRSYWYQVLSSTVVSSLEYERNQLERTDPEIYQEITNQRLKMSLRYFDHSGFFPFLAANWREQARRGGDFLDDGIDNFWLVDIGIGYRLPNRHGVVLLQALNIFDQDFTYDQSVGTEAFLNSGIGGALIFNVSF